MLNVLLYCYTVCAPLSKLINNKIGSSILHETIRFGLVYVDFTHHMRKIQISSNLFFNIDFSWQFLIPDTQGCGRICWLLSEILVCRPKMYKNNKIYNIGSYVVRMTYKTVLFHIQSPAFKVLKYVANNWLTVVNRLADWKPYRNTLICRLNGHTANCIVIEHVTKNTFQFVFSHLLLEIRSHAGRLIRLYASSYNPYKFLNQ